MVRYMCRQSLGCGCDVGTLNHGSWIYHRDSCTGIGNAILWSVIDAWNAEVVDTFMENH